MRRIAPFWALGIEHSAVEPRYLMLFFPGFDKGNQLRHEGEEMSLMLFIVRGEVFNTVSNRSNSSASL